MNEAEVHGWLPVGIGFESSGVTARWLEFRASELVEPFFQQTIRRLRMRRPPVREQVSDVKALVDYADGLPSVPPAVVIFHVSRCGSTLLVNALKTGDRVVALSEARPISALSSPVLVRKLAGHDRSLQGRRRLLDSVVQLFAHDSGQAPKVVIKCNAVSVLEISQMRAVWPAVPFVVVIRNPIEVIVSNLAGPASWVRGRHIAPGSQSVFGWSGREVARMSDEEYCARGLGCFYEAIGTQIDDRCQLVDYGDLDPARVRALAEWCGIALPPADSESFARAFAGYAKDPTGQRMFEPDKERKQREASASLVAVVGRWAQEQYEMLQRGTPVVFPGGTAPLRVH